MNQEVGTDVFVLFERLTLALETIADVVKKGGVDDKPAQEIAVDDSMGSCPECDSVEIEQKGRYPAAIYRCSKCSHLWVNSPEAFFKDD